MAGDYDIPVNPSARHEVDSAPLAERLPAVLARMNDAGKQLSPAKLENDSRVSIILRASDDLDTFVLTRFAGLRRGTLTRREEEIVGLVGLGLNNEDVGDRLGIRKATVAAYLRRIFLKLGAHSRAEVAVYRLAIEDDMRA